MRKRRSFAPSVAPAAALFVAAASAFAAPAKHHKPKQPAPVAADATPATSDATAQPAPAAPIKASDDAPVADAPPSASSKSDHEATPEPPRIPEAPAKPDHDDRDDAALGRREAARLAAGRVEVAASVSADVGSRHFTYSDPIGRLLAPYRLPIAPMASFGLEAYPLASSNVPFLRDLGFRGRISRAFAVDSRTPDGTTIDTSWTRFSGELRERLIVPGSHRFELGIDAGADASYFVLSTTTKVGALLPSARSISLRFGFDTRLLVTGQFSFLLGGAYLVTTSPGEIYDRFRDPRVGGVDGDFGVALGLTPGLEARLSGRYTRYFASFKPKLGDAAVAGGALDQQMQFGLGVRYAH